MGCGLLIGIACGDAFAGLLAATQAEMPGRRQPIGQDCKGLAARRTDPATHPNAFVLVVVGQAESPSMADDREALANRTLPRQEVQWDHPRVEVVFRLWQCDKENHGWREGRR